MADRSAIILLGILQRQGLTIEMLELMADFCTEHRTGSLTLHGIDGQLKSYEVHYTGRLTALHREAANYA
jgi:hypothetical protein